MHCSGCKVHFCLWCKSIIKADSKHKDDSAATHNHVFHCEKAPLNEEILTESKLFPVGHDAGDSGEFLDALLKVRKLEMLMFQMQQGEHHVCAYIFRKCTPQLTTSRLVICTMQTADADTRISRIACKFTRTAKEVQRTAPRQTEIAKVLLSQGERTWCVECTLSKELQVIGLDCQFDFDVSVHNPPWMNDLENTNLGSGHHRRARTPVQPVLEAANPLAVLHRNMQILEDMGLCHRYGTVFCNFMLRRMENNLDNAIAGIMEWEMGFIRK